MTLSKFNNSLAYHTLNLVSSKKGTKICNVFQNMLYYNQVRG